MPEPPLWSQHSQEFPSDRHDTDGDPVGRAYAHPAASACVADTATASLAKGNFVQSCNLVVVRRPRLTSIKAQRRNQWLDRGMGLHRSSASPGSLR